MYPKFRFEWYVINVALLTSDEAKECLASAADSLLITPRKTAVAEWQALEKDQPEKASAFSTTTRAAIIHELTVREVRRALSRPDAKACRARESEAHDFFAIVVGNELLIRYKFTAAGMPQNVATAVQRRLARQQYDEEAMGALELEGVTGPPTLATCGYTLEADGSLATVSLQCDYGKTRMWRMVVWGDSGERFGDIQTLPLDPTLSPEATIVRSATEEEQKPEAGSEE
jgi:hypothetical protein